MPAICSILRRLFNWTHGPVVAKLTRLWAASHRVDGTYEEIVEKLHRRYGPVVQVGPSLFSVSDHDYFEGLSKLEAASHPTHPTATIAFNKKVMSNIFRNEHLIDACNDKLFAFFSHSAHNKTPINMSNVIARYAYEIMIATTTGRSAGFLDIESEPAKVDRALREWRLYAILYGSYLRYHPFIAKVRKLCGLDKIARDGRFAMASEELQQDPSTYINDNTNPVAADIEARIALSLAGADPVITLILKAMQRIYADETLLENLRNEITAAELSFPVSFQQLIVKKDRLQLMLSVLVECSRIPPDGELHSYTSPEGGLFVGPAKLPSGATIILDPIPHVNSPVLGGDCSSWDPERWLDSSLAPDMKHHLLAHNISNPDGNSITMFRFLLGLKTCSHMAMFITLPEAAEMCWNEPVVVPSADGPIQRDDAPIPRADDKTLRSDHFSGTLSVPSLSDSAAVIEPSPLTPQDAAAFVFDLPTEIVVKLPPTATTESPAVVVPIPTKAAVATESAPVSRGGRPQRPARKVNTRLSRVQTAETNEVATAWVKFGNQEAQEAGRWSTVAGQAERKQKIAAAKNTAPAAARPYEVEFGPSKSSKNLPANMKAPAAKENEAKPTKAAFVPPHLQAAAKAKAEKESAEGTSM